MIGALVAATPAERRLLGGGRFKGPTPYVLAIMTFVMVIIATAGLALANAAGLAATGTEQRYSVQIVGGADRQPQAAEALGRIEGISAVRPVDPKAMRAMLERWLGPEGAGDDLPLPALIDVDLAPRASLDDVAKRIEGAISGAQFIAHREALAPLTAALRSLGLLAIGLVVLIAMATAAAVILATRGELVAHRATIEVMHGIGATDDQIARLFQRRIALDSLVGGTAGAVLAGVVLLVVAGAIQGWAEGFGGAVVIGAIDIAILALLPLLVAILATFVARYAVLRSLGERL
ncbi:cell division protein [Sphingomonas sp. HDW15A]|uniref:cell division protein FtsX n=1 Tax=Sphingomonas sp. HDW15A TaxID=2714942 RepID=UPI00140E4DC4|nr:cell division protein [Sphingomonas sp. HDW15A]QIK96987.1 cell division protein [Sphingomonas sp. HDW15A]